MKLLFLHGAIKNAGDFLISKRSQQLVKSIVKDCELMVFWEGTNFNLPKNKIYLSECDGIIFGGGPFFTNNIHPHDVPLINDLHTLDKPMINIGGGWFGIDDRYSSIKEYKMNKESLDLLSCIVESSGCLSCRDWHTVAMLKEKGFSSFMHGCPAWYDLSFIENSEFNYPSTIKSICISDPANLKNSDLAVLLIKWLRNAFPSAKISLIYHRDVINTPLFQYAFNNGIEITDISGSDDGFTIYDKCDLHIGFRVHAHIYNLSKRKFSILIEEDGRGSGVNHALGLNSIKAYAESKYSSYSLRERERVEDYKTNNYLCNEISNYIDKINSSEGLEYVQAFERMQLYFEKIKKHVNIINSW